MSRTERTTSRRHPALVLLPDTAAAGFVDLRDDPVTAATFAPPSAPAGVVRRPRLEARLDEGARGPLTLMSAPAGTGKTVLVATWAARRAASDPVVWLSLPQPTTGA